MAMLLACQDGHLENFQPCSTANRKPFMKATSYKNSEATTQAQNMYICPLYTVRGFSQPGQSASEESFSTFSAALLLYLAAFYSHHKCSNLKVAISEHLSHIAAFYR